MLISRVWLESMLAAPDGEPLSDTALGDTITSLGLEVDGVERVGDNLGGILVGEVKAVEPHPKADKLRLVTLADGKNDLPVVCGAPNVPAPGGRVAFAPVGTKFGEFEIASREIRGVRSEGMICSEQELGIGPDADGILVLDSGWPTGSRVAERVPGMIDTIYELGVTPNRPDALGHVGVARDLAVKLRCGVTVEPQGLSEAPAMPNLVTLDAPARCGRYIGRAFDGAVVGPSPLWLRVRLHRLGLRPINAVVDVTNLVLMQWGQPLHAFDRELLADGRVVVRMARPGEPMTTLDDAKLELDPEDLVIADAERPQALAGVMGGVDSGVLPGKRTLLLEAAWFEPVHIRRTARRHQLQTDSSYRFERGVDYGDNLTAAAAEASYWIEELTGAKCVGGHEVKGELPRAPFIQLRPARTTVVLGMEVPPKEARRVLDGLDVEVQDGDPECWRCHPPTWRPDLQLEEDLIEELVRHYGLDRLPSTPSIPSEPPGMRVNADQRLADQRLRLEGRIVDALRERGLCENVSFAFADPEQLKHFGARAVEVANPMRVQASLMRTHMLPGLLSVLALNEARHSRPVRVFEFGRIYDWPEESGEVFPDAGPTAEIDAQLPRERRRAAALLSWPRSLDYIGRQRLRGFDTDELQMRAREAHEATGIALDVLEQVGYAAEVRPPETPSPWLHPGVQGRLYVPALDREVGEVGELHPDLLAAWGLPKNRTGYFIELWFEALPIPDVPTFEAVPRFPATSRDLSLEVPIDLPASRVVAALQAAEAEVPVDGERPVRLAPGDTSSARIEVLDDYRDGVPEGARALLLRLHYRAPGRSVTDAEVQTRHQALVDHACEALRKDAPSVRTR